MAAELEWVFLPTTLVAWTRRPKVMKLLIVVSVTASAGPCSAGCSAMNSLPNSLKTTTAFWASVAVMLLLIAMTLTLARRRRLGSKPRRHRAAISRFTGLSEPANLNFASRSISRQQGSLWRAESVFPLRESRDGDERDPSPVGP